MKTVARREDYRIMYTKRADYGKSNVFQRFTRKEVKLKPVLDSRNNE